MTTRDVARKAEVSAATVSRALSAPEQVADATRGRVLAAAAELGYDVHRPGRGARARRVGRIGLVVPDLENPYFATFVKGAQSRARNRGRNVLLVDIDEDAIAERHVLSDLTKDVDGIIACSPRCEPGYVLAAGKRVPLVVVHSQVDTLPAIVLDDEDGARQAGRHLLALGHRQIAWVCGPATSSAGPRRRAGLQSVIDEVDGAELVDLGHFVANARGGAAAADQVLASGATAVVAFNDLIAVGLIEHAHRRGVRVPEDLSVVGFDGIGPGEYITPSLTTVCTDAGRLAGTVVDTLLRLLAHPGTDAASVEKIAVDLIVRGSTGIPRQTSGP